MGTEKSIPCALFLPHSPCYTIPRKEWIRPLPSGCCGVQCLYPGEDGCIEFGALKHGHYFLGCFDRKQCLSPLYGAKIYTGELPGRCKFMKYLSKKLHKNPDFGKELWEIGHDIGFFQAQ